MSEDPEPAEASATDRTTDGWARLAEDVANDRAPAPRAWPTGAWEVLRGAFPPVLEGDGVRALLAPVVAAVAWLGAGFREMVAGTAIDPLALLMRLLAVGLTTRALILGIGLAKRLVVASRASRARLVLAPEGLAFHDGARTITFDRKAITSIVEAGMWQTRRTSGRRWADVLVVGSARDLLYLAIPPLFEHSPGVLAEKLMRWLGPAPYEEERSFPDPAPLASKVYEDASRGITDAGTLVIPHGEGWARRGPYATILLAIVMVEGLARLEVDVPADLWPFAIGAVLVALVFPLGWWLMTRREISVRKGIALVLTPAELLLRTRAGVHRARWGKLQRVSIDTRRAFSVLDGVHETKTLVLKRKDEPPIRYDEAFLGLPAEVAQVLIDAYRTAQLPKDRALSATPSAAVASAADQATQLDETTSDAGTDHA
ncbi:MAG: hypothetical protein J0L92_26540 [Deltaproteobacteria bacterium]|nr:hypothetical protein [Deltaproteobacteria bacterium]